MSEVGKEAGNAYNKERSYGEAHVRYSLAVALDEGNLPALSNRAHTHLMVRAHASCLHACLHQ